MSERTLPAEADQAKTIEKEVRERVKDLQGFYIHLGIFLVINVMLVVLNLLTTPGYFWAIWPLLGWGVGLGAHAVSLFGLFGIGSQAWEERKVRELLLQRQRGLNAEQVRQLLREELDTEDDTPGPTDWERVHRRLENLEAIVTSTAWDRIDDLPDDTTARLTETPLDDEAPPRDPTEHAARLARRAR